MEVNYDRAAQTLWVDGVAFSTDFFKMFTEGFDMTWRVKRSGPLVECEELNRQQWHSEPPDLSDIKLYRAVIWDPFAANGGQWYGTVIGRGGNEFDANIYEWGSEVQISEYGDPMKWQKKVFWCGPPLEWPKPPEVKP